jgi:dihydroflavonol-4-reductase
VKVFVTGATGFIGGHLVKRLAETGHETVCLVRDPDRADRIKASGATLVKGDVTNKKSVLEGMKGCDWVMNLANIYAFWIPNKRAFTDINVEGTRNVMECAVENSVSKVVHLSTYGIWSNCKEMPFNEKTPTNAGQLSDSCEYVRTKYAGDLLAWKLYHENSLPLVMIHPGNVLGQGDNKPTGQFISDMVNRKMPVSAFNGTVFTFVHVRDVVEAILRAAEKEGNLGENYIVASEQMSVQDVMGMASDISGVPAPRLIVPGPLARLAAVLLTALAGITKKPPMMGMSVDQVNSMAASMRADGSKAQRELGITYTPIRTALEEAIPSYLEKPS